MRSLATLSPDRVFFDKDFVLFVLDRKDNKIFLVDDDIVGEVTAPASKLKISLEGSVIEESRALKSINFPSSKMVPPANSTAAS